MTNSPTHQKKRKLNSDEQKTKNSSSDEEEEVFINGNPKSKAKIHILKGTEETTFQVSSNYKPSKIIGKGTFGVVCSAENTETNEGVAIKKISFEDHPIRALRTLREVVITKHLQSHKAPIVKLKDIMIPTSALHKEKMDFKDIYLVFELMKSNLCNTIRFGKELEKFKDVDYRHLLVQLLLGLRHIHLSNIIHRDLKPENVLVDDSLNIKICDFGLSRAMRLTSEEPEEEETKDAKKKELEISNRVGTPGFRAPELTLDCKKYSNAVDIWSVACIYAELVNKKPLFRKKDTKPNEDQFNHIISILGTSFIGDIEKLDFIDNQEGLKRVKSAKENLLLPEVVPFSDIFPNLKPEAISLLESMLRFDPRKRITVEEALRHSYIMEEFDEIKDEFGYNEPVTKLIKNKDEVSIDTIRELLWNEMQSFHHHQNPNYDDDGNDDLS